MTIIYLGKNKHNRFGIHNYVFRKDILESPLKWENYSEKFKLLLYIEEIQMEVDIRRYNIPNEDQPEATMEKDQFKKNLLVLKVLFSVTSWT